MSLGALGVTTEVGEASALFLSGTAVVIPKQSWVATFI
jgi:hypothetical protein